MSTPLSDADLDAVRAWLACLAAAGVEVHTFYPDDFDEIVEVLSRC